MTAILKPKAYVFTEIKQKIFWFTKYQKNQPIKYNKGFYYFKLYQNIKMVISSVHMDHTQEVNGERSYS